MEWLKKKETKRSSFVCRFGVVQRMKFLADGSVFGLNCMPRCRESPQINHVCPNPTNQRQSKVGVMGMSLVLILC